VGSDELLLAVAAPEQIAALSHLAGDAEYSSASDEAKAFAKLEAGGDAEGVLKFRPTLVVFADYSRPELVAQVRRGGVKVLIFHRYASLTDAHDNLRTLARELGPEAEARAEAVIADGERRLRNLSDKLRGARAVKVIAPSVYGVIPGAQTNVQDLCDHAGAENLATTLGGLRGHAKTPSESLLAWPVERVIVAGENEEAALAPFRTLPPFQFLEAVKKGRVALLKPWQLSCVSHRRIDAYEQLARALHPEVFR
jgi:iron complex transport system substrate-binding protein